MDKHKSEDILQISSYSDLSLSAKINQNRLGNPIDESNFNCFNYGTGSSDDTEIRSINLEKNDKTAENCIDSTDQVHFYQ